MQSFKVTVELESPVVLSKNTFWTLDGICHGILEEMRSLGLTDIDPLAGVPLRCEDGLFHGSRAFFEGAVETEKTKSGGIRPVKDMDDATSFISTNRKRFPNVVTKRDEFKGLLSRYVETGAKSVSWIGTGDPDAVVALLRNAGAIGALRKEGHGKIRAVHAEIDDDLDPIYADGELLRPVPDGHATARRFNTDMPKMIDSWRPAYFDPSNRTVCYVPAR